MSVCLTVFILHFPVGAVIDTDNFHPSSSQSVIPSDFLPQIFLSLHELKVIHSFIAIAIIIIMPSYTLHTPAGSFRAFPALIAAEYNGIDVSVAEFDAEKVAKMSPSGKAPVLDLPNGQQLFSSHAIARYIAGIRRDVGLTGGGSLVDAAMIDAWMDFAGSELELPACVWFYPVAGYMPYNEDA